MLTKSSVHLKLELCFKIIKNLKSFVSFPHNVLTGHKYYVISFKKIIIQGQITNSHKKKYSYTSDDDSERAVVAIFIKV